MSKPRVALCFAGQPRFFDKGVLFFKKNLIDQNPEFEFECFFHGWFDKTKAGEEFDAAPWVVGRSDVLRPDTEERLREIYNTRGMLLEPQREFVVPRDYSSRMAKTPPYILYSLQYSIGQSIKLKREYEIKHNFRYEWVMRLRYDWALLEPIKLSSMDNTRIYYPNDIEIRDAKNDQFAFSNSKNMDYYGNAYPNIDHYWVTDEEMFFTGEDIIGVHLKRSGLPLSPLPIKYALIRQGDVGYKEISVDQIPSILD